MMRIAWALVGAAAAATLLAGCADGPVAQLHLLPRFQCCVFDGTVDSETRPLVWATTDSGKERPFEGRLVIEVERRCEPTAPWRDHYHLGADVQKESLRGADGHRFAFVAETGQTLNEQAGHYRTTGNLTLPDGRVLTATPQEYGQDLGKPCA